MIKCRIQRCALTAAGRACNDNNTVRLGKRLLEHIKILPLKPDMVNIMVNRRLIQNSHHDLFAVNRRYHRNTNIDIPPGRLDFEPAVLRKTPLGYIHLRKNLNPRYHCRLHPPRRRNHITKYPVYSHTNRHRTLLRLNMNIAGTTLNRLAQQQIHKSNHRRIRSVNFTAYISGKLFFCIITVIFGAHFQLSQITKTLLVKVAAVIDMLKGSLYLRLGTYQRLDFLLELQRHRIDRDHIQRVCHRNDYPPVFLPDCYQIKPLGYPLRNTAGNDHINLGKVIKAGKINGQKFTKSTGDIRPGKHLKTKKNLAQPAPVYVLLIESFF